MTYATGGSNAGSFNPLRVARDGTYIFMDTSQVPNLLSCNGNSPESVIFPLPPGKTWKSELKSCIST